MVIISYLKKLQDLVNTCKIKTMFDFHPYYTNDGSVGLYSPEFDDIYHSATGALTEAIEKFIEPVDMHNLMKNESIKVLDICYGLGYNSKSFLNYIYKKYFCRKNFLKKFFCIETSTEAIHTNNILRVSGNRNEILSPYNDKIYTDNNFPEISITSVDNDKILTYLSPFIKTGQKNFKNDKLDFEYEKIEKFIERGQRNRIPKIDKIINFLILTKIAQNMPDFLENPMLDKVLSDNSYKGFFDRQILGLYRFFQNCRIKYSHGYVKPFFLHNIYYQYISNRYKKRLKSYNLEDIDFNLKIGDARKVILEDKNEYDLIFLDAFTPTKCPCLWSYEFFKLLFEHLKTDGQILTYSKSASVRAAMLEAGFYIGNILDKSNNPIGTICTKNKSLIKHPLTEFDLGLLKTKAGIFYRDENLTGQNESINELRKLEVSKSDKISSSAYKKQYLN